MPVVEVSLIDSARVATPGLAVSLQDVDQISKHMGEALAEGVYRILLDGRRSQQARAAQGSSMIGADCSEFVPAVILALTDSRPRARYLVGSFGGVPAWLMPWLTLEPVAIIDAPPPVHRDPEADPRRFCEPECHNLLDGMHHPCCSQAFLLAESSEDHI